MVSGCSGQSLTQQPRASLDQALPRHMPGHGLRLIFATFLCCLAFIGSPRPARALLPDQRV